MILPVRPVTIPSFAFHFCRIGVTALLWAALLLSAPWLAVLCLVVLALSALLGVERSPLVVLWSQTVERLRPSRPVVLDRNGMRFAHAAGTLLLALAVALLYTQPAIGRWALLAVALLKTAAAAGGCSAMKLYQCLSDGGCCSGRRDA
jgi:uncharacterized membrane protein